MNTAAWLLWIVGGAVVVAALAKIMLVRRSQAVAQWQAEAATEKKKNRKQAS